MIYIFVTNNAIGSRLIRWGTRSTASHMLTARRARLSSKVIESRGGKGVFETTLRESLRGNKVVAAYSVELPAAKLDDMFENVAALKGNNYDFKGIFFFTVMLAVMDRVLRIGRSRENKWADKDDYTCSETILANRHILKRMTPIEEYSEQMISPDIAMDILERGDHRIQKIDLLKEIDMYA